MMCRVLKVSRSGFYAWRKRPESKQATSRRRLIGIIKEVHEESKRSYGSPRVHRELIARGEICCENTVARYMRENDIVAKTKRKFKQTTDSNHGLPVAENLLDREFDQTEPNRVWVSDITYIPTREGWLYLAMVLDLFGRKIVGWSMSHRIDRHLVMDALTMAIKNRRPPSGLIHHSDRGSQYASDDFQKLLGRTRHDLQHEPQGQLLGQRRGGKFFPFVENGAGVSRRFRDSRRSPACDFRVHRSVLQPDSSSFVARLLEPSGLRSVDAVRVVDAPKKVH